MVDDEDFGPLSKYSWNRQSCGYARAEVEHRKVYMHRLILGLRPGDRKHVDHLNGDRLDNRRVNLRTVTRYQNNQNRKPFKATGSGYRGVTWDKARRCWKAYYGLDGKMINLGRFATAKEAALVAAKARAEAMTHSREPLLESA